MRVYHSTVYSCRCIACTLLGVCFGGGMVLYHETRERRARECVYNAVSLVFESREE